MDRRCHQRGVSLLEALVACALVVVLVTLSSGSLAGLLERRRFDGLAQSIAQDFQHARGEAVLRNGNLSVAFGRDAAGSCYVFHRGPLDHCACRSDGSSTCQPDASEIHTAYWPDTDGIRLVKLPAPTTISGRLGTLTPTVTVELVNADGEGLDVVINATGRVRTCWQRRPFAGVPKCAKQRGHA